MTLGVSIATRIEASIIEDIRGSLLWYQWDKNDED